MLQAMLFDLDGTLIDTAADLGDALNRLRQDYGQPPLPLADIRPAIGQGSRHLLKCGFGITPADARFPLLQQRLFDYYAAHLTRNTQPFQGIKEVLSFLAQIKIPWGIVTNKPKRFTEPLVEALQLKNAACIISADHVSRPKPDPDGILLACKTLAVQPSCCIYVGDTEQDVRASQAANMPVWVALYGYYHPEQNPQTWQADDYLIEPIEIVSKLQKRLTDYVS